MMIQKAAATEMHIHDGTKSDGTEFLQMYLNSCSLQSGPMSATH